MQIEQNKWRRSYKFSHTSASKKSSMGRFFRSQLHSHTPPVCPARRAIIPSFHQFTSVLTINVNQAPIFLGVYKWEWELHIWDCDDGEHVINSFFTLHTQKVSRTYLLINSNAATTYSRSIRVVRPNRSQFHIINSSNSTWTEHRHVEYFHSKQIEMRDGAVCLKSWSNKLIEKQTTSDASVLTCYLFRTVIPSI